jgi:exodeoxyribonuclease III
MKLATWNVNSIRSRLPLVQDWLKTNQVDILAVQETKVIDPDFPQSSFIDLGYHVYFSGQKAYNGVAIFSKEKLTDINVGFAPILGDNFNDLDTQKRLISATCNDMIIINVYVPNGSSIGDEKYHYKLKWLQTLKVYLQTILKKSEHICICGDFNIALEDKDIYNPKGKQNHIMASPQEREVLQSILEIGLQDAFRKFTTEGGHYSWWDYRTGAFKRNSGWRIDHIYLTEKLSDRAQNCLIDIHPRTLEKPSDHTPVVLEFS